LTLYNGPNSQAQDTAVLPIPPGALILSCQHGLRLRNTFASTQVNAIADKSKQQKILNNLLLSYDHPDREAQIQQLIAKDLFIYKQERYRAIVHCGYQEHAATPISSHQQRVNLISAFLVSSNWRDLNVRFAQCSSNLNTDLLSSLNYQRICVAMYYITYQFMM